MNCKSSILLAVTLCIFAHAANAQSDNPPKLVEGIKIEKELDIVDLLEQKLVDVHIDYRSSKMNNFVLEVMPLKGKQKLIIPAGTVFEPTNPLSQNIVVIRTETIDLDKKTRVRIPTCCADPNKQFFSHTAYKIGRLPDCPVRRLCEELSRSKYVVPIKECQNRMWDTAESVR